MSNSCTMPNDDRVTLSLVDIARHLASGELSSVDVTTAFLNRIEVTQPQINSYAQVHADEALTAARESDARRANKNPRSRFDGVPISLKECVNIRGFPTTIGLPSRVGDRATSDGALTQIAKEAGCVVLGKTNVSQAMLFNEASNPVYGRTSNPFNFDRGPGGSSGGEGAAIGSYSSPGGIGTDIGGSIRLPAVYNGIVGLLPTVDRISNRGNVPGIPGQEVIRGQAGPMARSTEDVCALLELFSPEKCAKLDPRVKPFPIPPPEDVSLKGMRIGMCHEDGLIRPAASMLRALAEAREVFEAAGAEVIPFRPPFVDEIPFLYVALMSADGTKTLSEQVDKDELDPALMTLWRIARVPAPAKKVLGRALGLPDPILGRLLQNIGERTVADVWKLTTRARFIANEVFDAWSHQNIDAMIAPVHGTVGLPHGLSRDTTLAHSWSFHFNFLGYPAVGLSTTTVLPKEQSRPKQPGRIAKILSECDAQSAGMPSGIQIAARPYREHIALRLSSVLHAATKDRPDFPKLPSA